MKKEDVLNELKNYLFFSEGDIYQEKLLQLLNNAELFAKDDNNIELNFNLGIGYRNYCAWFIRGDERKIYLEKSLRYFQRAYSEGKKQNDNEFIISIASDYGIQLIGEALTRDLDKGISILEEVWDNTKDYEPCLCWLLDGYYKKQEYLKSMGYAEELHKRALDSDKWGKYPPPPAPMKRFAKACRALAMKLKKEGNIEESKKYFEMLVSNEFSTENDKKVLSKL